MNCFYNVVFPFARLIFGCIYPRRKRVCPAIPEGAAIICANHSHAIDPVLVALTVGRRNQLHFMAKQELSAKKIPAAFLKKLGAFFVNRGGHDLGAIKTAMSLLKKGEKVGIFPEGTRVSEETAVVAKTGAVRLAMRMGVPLVPVYISSVKKPFSPLDVVVGTPYFISENDNVHEKTIELMDKIYSLNPGRTK